MALAAKSTTTTVPIVMTAAGARGRRSGSSLARPGANVTGLAALSTELNTKRLEILRDGVPKLARVGLLWSRESSAITRPQLKELRAAALALKLKLEEIEAQLDAKGLESAFKAQSRNRWARL